MKNLDDPTVLTILYPCSTCESADEAKQVGNGSGSYVHFFCRYYNKEFTSSVSWSSNITPFDFPPVFRGKVPKYKKTIKKGFFRTTIEEEFLGYEDLPLCPIADSLVPQEV